MRKTDKGERIQARFRIDNQKWKRFQSQCQNRGTTETEILNAWIESYLEQDLNRFIATISTPSKLAIESESEAFLKDDLSASIRQSIDTQVLHAIEHHLNLQFDERIRQQVQQLFDELIGLCLSEMLDRKLDERFDRWRSAQEHKPDGPTTTPTPTTQLASPSPELKTAKELAAILGCSPSYITTLNRIGELVKRGWKDSGNRQGKRILYERLESSNTEEN